MLLEALLPTYDFHEVHTIVIRAAPEQVFRAVQQVTSAEITIMRPFMAVRSLPALLLGHKTPLARSPASLRRPVLEAALRGGFSVLGEEQPRELVIGIIGQFWKLAPGGATVQISNAEAFTSFAQPGYAKAAMNFLLEELGAGPQVKLSTETRILATDAQARRKFARYWWVIFPGSALIRRSWLRAIQRRAERQG